MQHENSLDNSAGVATCAGRALALLGLGAWAVGIGWQLTQPVYGLVGIAALTLEMLALLAAAILTAGLWPGRSRSVTVVRGQSATIGRQTMPEVMAVVLSVDSSLVEGGGEFSGEVGVDDTGEVAWARRGFRVLGGLRTRRSSPTIRDAAWSVVALDGVRRSLLVALLVVVLFTGNVPFDVPPLRWVALLVTGLTCLSIGHWLLSDGRLRPGARQVWSMASIGAGLGDGVSRSALPIRWMATISTMVVLNLAISLRGLSDRWTHGLGAMAHDARVAAMSLGLGLVGLGFMALRTLPPPDLDFYGATRRLEETSARRLALGATVGVAVLGFVAGVVPVQQ